MIQLGTSNPAVFYIYSGDTLLGEIAQNGTVNTAYTWGADGLISERLVNTARSLWYGFGPQGETRLLTDASGTVADSYLYTSYGAPVVTTGSDYNPFQFGGQAGYYTETALALGTIYCQRRWYDSYLGRWLSRDPVGLVVGGQNLYAYCANDPVNRLDPSGLLPPTIVGHYAGPRQGGGIGVPPSWWSNFWNRAGNWYMGGMGGISQLVDNALMGGATANFGTVAGEYDAGQASGWDLAGAGTRFGANLGMAAFSLVDGAGETEMGAGEAIKVASSAGSDVAPASIVRMIGNEDNLADLVNELKELTWQNGVEHAIVSTPTGERAIVSGGKYGIEFAEGSIRRILVHTHPYDVPAAGPSAADLNALSQLGQKSSYIIERGVLYRFWR